MRFLHATTALLSLAVLALPSAAQHYRDPLNDEEISELREAAQDPPERIKLYLKFARARMEALEQLQAGTKPDDAKAAKTRELLADFTTLVDELDDNLDTYSKRGADLREQLRQVIQADTEWQTKLHTMRESLSPLQLKTLGFPLEDALDSVTASAESAQALLSQQQERKGAEKPPKH